jgi:hypothetical protein
MFCENESIGCNICKKVKSLGLGAFRTKGQHLSNEWSGCSVRRDGEKATAQKALRKKIKKHARSQAHIAAIVTFYQSKMKEKSRRHHSTVLHNQEN